MTLAAPLSVTALAADIRRGLSPVTVLDRCLSRIAARDGDLNAMVHVDSDGAYAAARAAETELARGIDRGPLHGIPIALKDMIDVAGLPTTAGSRLFDGRIAVQDAACVANLRLAGAVIIGKTNMHELTAGPADNPWLGKVVNPRDPGRGTAGTSSGSAAAVAAGFCAAAVGSDTGGSNRSVAAATGLCGFKPTNGLIDAEGSLPTAPSLDCLGPIAGSVADLRLMAEAMTGKPLPRSAPPEIITIALCPDLTGSEIDTAVEDEIAHWLDRRRSAGAKIVTGAFRNRDAFVDAGLAILLAEFADHYGPIINAAPDTVGAAVHQFLDAGRAIDAAALDAARATRAGAIAELDALFAGADVLAVPTAPGRAPRLSDETTEVNGARVPFGPAGGPLRRWANMLCLPAVALPVSDAALPASLQLAARPGEDARLLTIAEALTKPSHRTAHAPVSGDRQPEEPA